MLAPPPEGTFDIDEASLPIKNSSKDDTTAPEQVPLLNDDSVPSYSDVPKRGKVRINLICVYSDVCFSGSIVFTISLVIKNFLL